MPDPVGLFSIAVACGEMDSAEMQSQGIHYWALGGRPSGRHCSSRLVSPTIRARRKAAARRNTGAAAAVRWFRSMNAATRKPVPRGSAPCRAAPLEWHEESITVSPATGRDELESMCAQRIRALASHAKGDVLVAWSIGGHGPILAELRRGKLRGELLEWLRIEHGLSSPIVWTVRLDAAPDAAVPPALYEQETLLGDYLRELRAYETDPARPLAVESLLAGTFAGESLASSVVIADGTARRRVLHEAALLGVDLLSGEEGGMTVTKKGFAIRWCRNYNAS